MEVTSGPASCCTVDDEARRPRVAYTLEQCWHRVPGGMATAAIEVARAMPPDAAELIGVAGRHARPAPAAYTPPITVRTLPIGRPWLYESWLRAGWPKVEGATGPVDVVHATGLVPAACLAPLVVTVHDLAFLHTPEHFTRHGSRMMLRSLGVIRRRAALVLCSSTATMEDCAANGIDAARLRYVPLGTSAAETADDDAERVRAQYSLPDHFVLFVGTIEPRKNLRRLHAAVGQLGNVPLVVAGSEGWGDARPDAAGAQVRFLGFVPPGDLPGLYKAATVFAYPSEREGFGLPVLEAMAQGTPVVTSAGTSTEEVAGGAAVLVAPTDIESIAAGLAEAQRRSRELGDAGRVRAREMTWAATAKATAAVYREASA